MYTPQRIPLSGLPNTRDIGGYQAHDGRKIKPRLLIRSGELACATVEDINTLINNYNLKTIVDFRTVTERNRNPDPEIKGVNSVHIPILDESPMGIIKGTGIETNPMGSVIEAMLKRDAAATDYMKYIYGSLITSVSAANGYRRFFKVLLENDRGAVLWHCSAGKDRAGTATVLLMEALGIPSDIIAEDYLLSNRYISAEAEKAVNSIAKMTSDDRAISFVRGISTVSPEYIKTIYETVHRLYGSMQEYLREVMELDSEKIELLRHMYLK